MIRFIFLFSVCFPMASEAQFRPGFQKPRDLYQPISRRPSVHTASTLSALSAVELGGIYDLHLKISGDEDLSILKRMYKIKYITFDYYGSGDLPLLTVPLAVKVLEVRNFPGTSLPETLYKYTSLEELLIKGGALEQLPKEISKFYYLKRLYVEGVPVRSLPKALSDRRLASLTLRRCGQLELDGAILPRELQHLDLSANGLEVFPYDPFKLRSLRVLDLSGNKFRKMPFALDGMNELMEVDVRDCPFDNFPKELTMNVRLRSLKLGGFKCDVRDITFLPRSSFEKLVLTGMKLTRVPVGVLTLGRLRELDLSDNRITSLLSGTAKALPQLKVLSIARNNIKTFPSQLASFKSLQRLDISGCGMQSINFASEMLNLEYLYASENKLRTGRINLEGLVALKVLDLSHCEIRKKPLAGASLPALRSLDLSDNELAVLEEDFTKLASLQNLSLIRNKFESFPKVLTSSSTLRFVDIEGNGLKSERVKGLRVNYGKSSSSARAIYR